MDYRLVSLLGTKHSLLFSYDKLNQHPYAQESLRDLWEHQDYLCAPPQLWRPFELILAIAHDEPHDI